MFQRLPGHQALIAAAALISTFRWRTLVPGQVAEICGSIRADAAALAPATGDAAEPAAAEAGPVSAAPHAAMPCW